MCIHSPPPTIHHISWSLIWGSVFGRCQREYRQFLGAVDWVSSSRVSMVQMSSVSELSVRLTSVNGCCHIHLSDHTMSHTSLICEGLIAVSIAFLAIIKDNPQQQHTQQVKPSTRLSSVSISGDEQAKWNWFSCLVWRRCVDYDSPA